MKKTLYLLLLFIGVSFFTSCADKEKKEDILQMTGVWKFDNGLVLDMTTPDDSITLVTDEIQRLHKDEFIGLIYVVGGSYAKEYLEALNWIEFTKEGDVIISYTANEQVELIDKGMIRYYLKNGKVYIGTKPEVLAGLIGDSFDVSKLPGIEIINGDITMPLCYRVKDGKAEIYIDKVFMAPLLDMVAGMLPAEIAPMALPFINVIKDKTTLTFELGVKLATTTK